jgi:hypothetical protein
MTDLVVNVSDCPKDLHTGRVLAPGESARVSVTQHELDQIAAGHLARRPRPPRKRTGTTQTKGD